MLRGRKNSTGDDNYSWYLNKCVYCLKVDIAACKKIQTLISQLCWKSLSLFYRYWLLTNPHCKLNAAITQMYKLRCCKSSPNLCDQYHIVYEKETWYLVISNWDTCTIRYDTIRYDTIRYHTIPYHTIPYHTIPYHTIPYHTIPYHTIPYHTIPYHTIPYHTIPYHTIPYHTCTMTILLQTNLPGSISYASR